MSDFFILKPNALSISYVSFSTADKVRQNEREADANRKQHTKVNVY